MPRSGNLYTAYIQSYVYARAGKDVVPGVGNDDSSEMHAAQALGIHDGKSERPPRRVASLNAAVQTLVTGPAIEFVEGEL